MSALFAKLKAWAMLARDLRIRGFSILPEIVPTAHLRTGWEVPEHGWMPAPDLFDCLGVDRLGDIASVVSERVRSTVCGHVGTPLNREFDGELGEHGAARSSRTEGDLLTHQPFSMAVPTEGLQDEFQRAAVRIDTWAGHCNYFRPALIHGSRPNRTDSQRMEVTFALPPKGAETFQFVEDEAGAMSGFRLEPEFYRRHEFGEWPSNMVPVEPWVRAVSAEDMSVGFGHLVDVGAD